MTMCRPKREMYRAEPISNVIGTDASPVLAGKIAVGQRLLNAILYLLGRLFQFHGAQFFHHSFGLFPGCFLAFLGVDRLEHLGQIRYNKLRKLNRG